MGEPRKKLRRLFARHPKSAQDVANSIVGRDLQQTNISGDQYINVIYVDEQGREQARRLGIPGTPASPR